MESLHRLQGLHADLVAHTQKSLSNIDRLWQELQDSIEEFRALLDKTQSTSAEVKAYNEGRIEVGGLEYSINEEFRHLSNAIGVALDVSEEHAGRLIIETQNPGNDDEQVQIADVVQKYHDRRDFLLQDLRLVLQQSQNLELDEHERNGFKESVETILDTKNGVLANGSQFARKCIDTMGYIEARQATLNEQIQSKAILSQARGDAFYRTLEFQRSSLFKQHEALGAVLALLFRGNYTISEDLRKMFDKAKKWQRLDFSWIHYLPAFAAAFHRYGSPEGNGQPQEAQQLNRALVAEKTDDPNGLYRPLIATLEMWWTAEYSGFYRDNAAPDPQASKRADIMKRALDDGSLEFMLSICTNMKNDPWQSFARRELVDMLLDGSNATFDYIEPTSTYFVTLMMEVYEAFADSWITNMPDSIRRLKTDEDDRRLLQITTSTEGLMQRPPRDQGVRLHLEAFLVLIAFTYEGRSEAAEQFWEDPDGNLYGFLHWASRRQTVPRVSAFCEMLCAISEESDNAQAAHKFLMDDAVAVPGMRGKKLPSMSYSQIFAELEFYAKKVHEKAQVSQTTKVRHSVEPELNETESPIMLSCYLRLLGHLFRQTPLARGYVLTLPEPDLLRSLLALSSGPIPSFLRASIFTLFEALLTDKNLNTSDRIWITLEDWAATNHDRGLGAPNDKQPLPSYASLQNTLSAVASSHDQYDAFVKLLLALIGPLPQHSGQPLPFPPDLGGNYRFPGITPYVDFVCGQLSSSNVRTWTEDGNAHGAIRTIKCVEFFMACLRGFNEKMIVTLGKPGGKSPEEQYELMYAQRHPFSRVMQWVFSTNGNKCVLDLLHQSIEIIENATPDEPRTISLQRVLELSNTVINLQPTYFDIVKPNAISNDGYKQIQFSGITAVEDSIISRPELLLDLCRYAASGHVQLSLQSLEFLQKLSESSRFQNHLFDETKLDKTGRKMIEMLGPVGEIQLKHISLTLARHFVVDGRELETGGDSDMYLLKDGLLAFLNACLTTQSESPNIAHLLLGFERVGNRLGFTKEFEEGVSMFDSLVCLACTYPDSFEGNLLAWLLHIKAETLCVLKHLWSFPVSSDLAMTQLRRENFLVEQFLNQTIVSQGTLWDGISILDWDFYFRTSAEAFTDLLSYRGHLCDYVTREIQYVAKANVRALQEKYLSTLQGKSVDADGIAINHASVFELFDFAELDTAIPESLALPTLEFFHDIDFDHYIKDQLYEVDRVQAVINRRCAQIAEAYLALVQQNLATGGVKPLDVDSLNNEADFMIGLLEARNRHVLAKVERITCLRSYVNMVIAIVDYCPMDAATKTQFILHMLQLILPKLDTHLSDGTPEAVELTRMADTLLYALATIETSKPTLTKQAQVQTRIDITVAEKLYQLFRICVEGVPLSATNPDLRAVLYSICAQYLTRVLHNPTSPSPNNTTDSSKKARTNAMDTVRSTGVQLITILSDDADDGLDTCRLNALNLLAQLVALARSQSTITIIESFVKANIIEVLLDPIKTIAGDFQGVDSANRTHLLTLHSSRTHLLLQISLTRPGASALLDANLLQTLRDCHLFAADPDLGFDLVSADPSVLIRAGSGALTQSATTRVGDGVTQTKNALVTYFTLLSSLLRLLLSTFLSFGPENEKLIYLVRTFLSEYRGNMVGVFKRAAGMNTSAQTMGMSTTNQALSATERDLRSVVDECARIYTGLAVGSGFLEFEDERGVGGNGMVTPGTGMGRSMYGSGNGFS